MENTYQQSYMPENAYTPAKKPRTRDWKKNTDPETIKEPSDQTTWIPFDIDDEGLEERIKRTPYIPN